MRHVVDTSEVPHLWTHQSQSDARNSQGNLFFEQRTIYSYGHHFPIAQHVMNKRGEKAVVITTCGYSSTTAGHISTVKMAIPDDVLTFHVDFTNHWQAGKTDVEEYNRRIAEHEVKAARARKRADWDLRQASELHTEALAFCKFYGLRFKVNNLRTDLATVKAAAAKDSAKKAKETKLAKAKQEQEYADAIAAWLRGEYAHLPYGIDTLLRVKDGEVETSRGARFPVDHARRGLVLVEAVRAKGEPWQRNGHTCHLGHYQIDRIEANGTVHAGCHVVPWKSIERIREQLLSA
jgi:hypothetical protein